MYTKKTAHYQREWEKYEKKLLEGMMKCFELDFYLKTIDVHVAPYVFPQSSPLLMNTYHKPDEFVDVLAHELIHVLFSDNTLPRATDKKYTARWKESYPQE